MAANEMFVPVFQGGPNRTVYGAGRDQLLQAEQEAFENACQSHPDGEELLAKQRQEVDAAFSTEHVQRWSVATPETAEQATSFQELIRGIRLQMARNEERARQRSCPTKTENDRFFQSGFYGNKLRTWTSYGQWEWSGYLGRVSIRYKEPQSPWCRYDVTPDHVPVWIQQFVAEGADRAKFIFGEMAPDERLTLQGELRRCETGLELFCSTFKGRMREALTNANGNTTFTGVSALAVLQTYLTGSSWSDLQELLELFPDHVIEFSAYEMCLGSCRGRNALVWEIRSY